MDLETIVLIAKNSIVQHCARELCSLRHIEAASLSQWSSIFHQGLQLILGCLVNHGEGGSAVIYSKVQNPTLSAKPNNRAPLANRFSTY